MPLNIVVWGASNSGKSTFVRTLATYEQAVLPEHMAVSAIDFARITIDEDSSLYCYSTPAARRFDFMWEILEDCIGFIAVVDSASPETFREAKSVCRTLQFYSPLPYIITANKQELPNAWSLDDLRIILSVPDEIPVVPCIATDRESVKNVLITLLEKVLEP